LVGHILATVICIIFPYSLTIQQGKTKQLTCHVAGGCCL